jgi:pyruvate dehydrogenase E1 component
MLLEDHDVAADVWSATSYKLLREDALDAERWNRLHPTEAPRTPYVTEQLGGEERPIVAVTDFLKSVPDQIGRFVPQPFIPLGTDGFGYSDTRQALRRHFEVDAAHIVVATLDGLAMQGKVKGEAVEKAIRLYGIDPDAPDPRTT